MRDPEDEAALADTVWAALRQIEEKAYDIELAAAFLCVAGGTLCFFTRVHC